MLCLIKYSIKLLFLFLILILLPINSYAACTPYQPKVNGCSTYNAELYIGGVDPAAGVVVAASKSLFKSHCNNHDRCYGKIGNTKDYCDSTFIKDIQAQCKKSFPGNWQIYKEVTKVVMESVTSASKCGTKKVNIGTGLKCLIHPYLCQIDVAKTCLVPVTKKLMTWVEDNSLAIAEYIALGPNAKWIGDSAYLTCTNIVVPGYKAAIQSSIAKNGFKDYQSLALTHADNILGVNTSCDTNTNLTTNLHTFTLSTKNSNVFSLVDKYNLGPYNAWDPNYIDQLYSIYNLIKGTNYIWDSSITTTRIPQAVENLWYDYFVKVPLAGFTPLCNAGSASADMNVALIPDATTSTMWTQNNPNTGLFEVCWLPANFDPNWQYRYINYLRTGNSPAIFPRF